MGYGDFLKLFDPDFYRPSLVIVNLSIDYFTEIFLGSEARLISGTEKAGRSSLVIRQEINQNGRICVRARSTFVHFDFITGRPRTITYQERKAITDHLFVTEERNAAGSPFDQT